MSAAEGKTPKLRIGQVLRIVLHVYRRRWKFLVPLSILVLLPQSLADAAFGDVQVDRVETAADVLQLASIPIALAINLTGEALYAGIVAAAVVEWLAGRELRDVPGTARSISYGRLIAIDVILAVGTTIGLVLLIVPGIVFFTYLAVSPALIELSGISVREAVRKSIELVRGNFWQVLAFSLTVLLLSQTLTALLESPIHGVHGELLFNLLIEAVIEPFQGLTTVFLGLALLDLHGRDRRLSAYIERTWGAG